LISQEEYYPFGGTAVWAARNEVEASYKTVRYSGKERDATGLYYYGYRYYQPWAGRWLSADPAGTVDGLNLFCMVRNNPLTFADEEGLLSAEVSKSVDSVIKKTVRHLDRAISAIENNTQAVDDVMHVFFGDSTEAHKQAWKQELIKVKSVALETSVSRNAVAITTSNMVAEVDMSQARFFLGYVDAVERLGNVKEAKSKKDYKQQLNEKKNDYADARNAKFLRVDEENWKVAGRRGEDFLIKTLIHEFSHAAVDTLDYFYGKIKEGEDPTPLYGLPRGKVDLAAQGSDYKKVSQKSDIDYAQLSRRNADSFGYAALMLSFSESRQEARRNKYSKAISQQPLS
ncbi:RHS repeat-associated core domain-containing protein, partial [Pseudomonas guariconensis]|uniref:RHS repeat-associated core domain-containing protein n=1 Tax=Pseudomonas guariconensis TaxID=1288410 RepID=UPI001E5C9BCA